MALDNTKKTEQVKFNCTERLYVELNRLAALDQRSLSDYLNLVVVRHVFGHRSPDAENITGTNCPTSSL